MKRLFSILSIIVGGLMTAVVTNAQCDCNDKPYKTGTDRGRSQYENAYDELQNSDLVFVGKVKKVKRVSGEGIYYNQIMFETSKSWRKNIKKQLYIRTDATCIIDFKKDEEYLVYASNMNGNLQTKYCSRTRKLVEAKADLTKFAEKGEKALEIKDK